MFPQPSDRANYQYPWDGLLQAYGVVKDDEIRNPQHLDVYGEKCLLVVKNGLTTGTTVGRTNGLESFTRIYDEYGIKQTSIEIAVLPYDKTHRKFSEAKVKFIGGYLRGKVWNWFEPILRERDTKPRSEWSERAIRILGSYKELKKAMSQVFDDIDERKTAARELQKLRQTKSVT
jgi:hypothetical protein